MKRLVICFFLALTLLPLSTTMAQEERKAESAQNEQSGLVLTVSGNSVRIQNATSGSQVEVYNILGVKVTSARVELADKTVTLNLPKGYYIFKIGNIVRKVVIK